MIPSGNLTKLLKIAIEIVSCPIKSSESFHSYVSQYQGINPIKNHHTMATMDLSPIKIHHHEHYPINQTPHYQSVLPSP